MTGQEQTQQLLAVTIAVGLGGVEEVDAFRHGQLERRHRFLVLGAGPATHAPHAETDFADLPAEPPKSPMTHPHTSS